jgi:hypothetical protein
MVCAFWVRAAAYQHRVELHCAAAVRTKGVMPCSCAAAAMCRPGVWMGAENFLLIVAAVVYGYNATMLLFGTFHCLSIICGAYWPACRPVGWPADGGAPCSC